MTKTLLILSITTLAISCAYENSGNYEAQKEAKRIYEESLAKCNEIKGKYEGTLQGADSLTAMSGIVSCEISSESQTDKNNTTIFQVIPEIYLYRNDLPIPSILQILDQGSEIGMRTKSKGGANTPGQNGGASGLPDGMIGPAGSLIGSVSFEPFTSFQGKRTNSQIIGDLRTTQLVGTLTLNKISNEPEVNELLTLNEKVEQKLVEELWKYMGSYHGCLFLEPLNPDRAPIGISVTLSIDDNIFQGKSMKALRARFFRNDLPGNPALAELRMQVGLSWKKSNLEQTMSIVLEALPSPQNVNYVPILNGTLITPVNVKTVDSTHWFYGTFESKREIGQFRLFKQNAPVRDCRVYQDKLRP